MSADKALRDEKVRITSGCECWGRMTCLGHEPIGRKRTISRNGECARKERDDRLERIWRECRKRANGMREERGERTRPGERLVGGEREMYLDAKWDR